ncbi:uncharacterized protein LOC130512327 isoform X1 [Raphanus sativus]|uniref:Uncharacterized protein LOC108832900 isoform X1 n=1 Tax=Raphanus sativus TaxID=3726 RepID=A0A6J0LNM5_RAPSA|nr:uncharacterized protein LOC108832900 isoform X1 [Raphanus sativus]XP_056848390.1 uncharacterized protein LOC130498799 isoform X1 [Raphanus sativus]XP_056866159.1 uncharacterized protein LOC130512327 isoform X1 [Raphanus sativus]
MMCTRWRLMGPLFVSLRRGDSCLRSKEQHQKVERVRVKDNAFVGRSVKIDVVDDTALLNVVPFCKKGKDHHPKRSGAAHSDDKEALNKPEGGIKVEWHRYSRFCIGCTKMKPCECLCTLSRDLGKPVKVPFVHKTFTLFS